MAHYKTSRILPTFLVIIVIIIAIAGLVAVARALFFPGSSNTSREQVDLSQQALLNTADGSSVQMAVRGPIVANENFRSYSILISPTQRTIKTYTGYLDTVLEEQTLDNNTAAYAEFVHALNLAGLSRGVQLKEDDTLLGICAGGRLYQFSTLQNADPVETLWTSTCSGSKGTLRASTEQLSNLFWAQIPSAGTMIQKANLR